MNSKNIALFAIGPVLGAIVSVVSLSLVAWLFAQDDVGRMSMVLVVSSFAVMLYSLGLDQAYVRDYHAANQHSALFWLVFLPGLVLLLISALAVVFLFSTGFSELLFGRGSELLTIMVLLYIVCAFVIRFFSLILRMEERGGAYSLALVLPKVLLLAGVLSYMVLSTAYSLEMLVQAHLFSVIVVGVLLVWLIHKSLNVIDLREVAPRQLGAKLKFGLPLIIGGLAYWGLTSVDKVFLRWLSGYEELGLYSVAVGFAGVAALLQSVFSTVWAPTVYKWVETGEDITRIRHVTRYVMICILLIVGVVGSLSWVLTWILPPTYAQVEQLILICMIPPLFYTLSETTVVGIGVTRKTSLAMLAAVLALVVNLLGNYLLIPEFGAQGAAISTALSFYIFLVLRTLFSSQVWREMPRSRVLSLSLALLLTVILLNFSADRLGLTQHLIWVLLTMATVLYFRRDLRLAYHYLRVRN